MACPIRDPASFVQALRAKSSDNSPSSRLRIVKAQTLATYHANNPSLNDYGGSAKSSDALTLLLRKVGTNEEPGACNYCTPCISVCDLLGTFVFPLTNNPDDASFYYGNLQARFNSDFTPSTTIPPPPPEFPIDYSNYGIIVYTEPVCNATSYTINFTDINGVVASNIYNLGTLTSSEGVAVFMVIWPLRIWDFSSAIVRVTASNTCSSSSEDAQFGCFLEGAPVTMADGSTKPIEAVVVGDAVLGAFGEINTVLALHRPRLGAGSVIVINNEHTSTAHHPHISVDRKFYCAEPTLLSGFTYGRSHTVILANGETSKWVMPGVNKDCILKLDIGVQLQTVTGARTVNTIVHTPMSPLTQVYHLVVSGSHTFNVEGYAVTGWANDTDFDYTTWTPK